MIDPITRFFSMILVFFMLNFSAITGKKDADAQIIADNIAQNLIDGTETPFAASDIIDGDTLISLIADSDDGYYFTDVDYNNGDRTTWIAARHITRTERLALLYRTENDAEKKEVYKNYVLGLLDYWLAKDYQNSNWWHNKLSNPNILGEIGVLMKSDLGSKQLRKLAAFVGRGCYTVSPALYVYTGANAIDLSMSTIKFGALTDNGKAIKAAVKVISDQLKYSSLEGLKKDGTFFQHGSRLYMGGYGINFVNGISSIITMTDGTSYSFSESQLTPFAGFILDGLRTMSFGNTLDPTTMGRSVSRINAQPLSGIVPSLLALAGTENMPRKDELTEYALSISGNTKNDKGLHFFNDAKFLVINNADFYFSFRGGSNTLLYGEMINDENILGYNTSFPGVTTVMTTGNEYRDIAPVYDYSFVPGTTAVYETDAQLKAHGDFSNKVRTGTYSDAVADGAAVVSAKTKHDGISMTVSCFATDNAAVILGAGMNDSNGREMNTTLEQSFAAGAFTENGNTVVHNGVKYTVLDGGELTAKSEVRTGNWTRNNLTYPDYPASGEIFTLSMKNTGTYAYTVMAENTDADFEVISNTEKIQAVKLPDGSIAATFFAKGSFSYEGKTYEGKAGTSYIF